MLEPDSPLGLRTRERGREPGHPSGAVELHATLADRERLAALRRLVLLDTPPTEAFDRLVRLVARVLSCPIALLTLVDADRQYFKAAFGLPEPLASVRQTPLTHSICQHVVARGERLVVCDAMVEHWLDDNLAVKEFGVRAYLGTPLVTTDGYVVGTLCALDVQPRFWTAAELANLDDLAGATMREISLHRLERMLSHQRAWRGVAGTPPGL
jgi:GAF domain-containing protein